jgi:hypothetical protein
MPGGLGRALPGDELFDGVPKSVLDRRGGRPEEIVFLCSFEASCLTGTTRPPDDRAKGDTRRAPSGGIFWTQSQRHVSHISGVALTIMVSPRARQMRNQLPAPAVAPVWTKLWVRLLAALILILPLSVLLSGH